MVDEPHRKYERIRRGITFYSGEDYLREGDHWIRLQVPEDSITGIADGWLFVQLRTAWKPGATEFKAGSLIAANLDRFLSGGREFEALFEPEPRLALQDYIVTRDRVVLNLLDNVKGRVIEVARAGGKWVKKEVAVPRSSTIGIAPYDRDTSDDYWLTVTSFTAPTTLYLDAPGGTQRDKMKSLPAFFDAKGLEVSQFEATSKDGTQGPVLPRDARGSEARREHAHHPLRLRRLRGRR